MKNKKFTVAVAMILCFALCVFLTSCGVDWWTEADEANKQLSHEADYFNVERRITVYNARTDTVVLYIEGYMSLSNNTTNELVVTCKTGNNTYKKNYVYLNENTIYVMEDISGTHADPYHYKLYINTVLFHPDVVVK
mgnify:CR=1 FL=1